MNTSLIKDIFPELLSYPSFMDFIATCSFQTSQMRVIESLNAKEATNGSLILQHKNSFLEKEFYEKFTDTKGSDRFV